MPPSRPPPRPPRLSRPPPPPPPPRLKEKARLPQAPPPKTSSREEHSRSYPAMQHGRASSGGIPSHFGGDVLIETKENASEIATARKQDKSSTINNLDSSPATAQSNQNHSNTSLRVAQTPTQNLQPVVDHIPIFSPSQIPSNEKVLHSIFSPPVTQDGGECVLHREAAIPRPAGNCMGEETNSQSSSGHFVPQANEKSFSHPASNRLRPELDIIPECQEDSTLSSVSERTQYSVERKRDGVGSAAPEIVIGSLNREPCIKNKSEHIQTQSCKINRENDTDSDDSTTTLDIVIPSISPFSTTAKAEKDYPVGKYNPDMINRNESSDKELMSQRKSGKFQRRFEDYQSEASQQFYSPDSNIYECHDNYAWEGLERHGHYENISPVSKSQCTMLIDAFSSSSVFMSPLSALADNSPSEIIRKENSHVDASFHSLPIEMFDFERVSNCSSVMELEQIVSALSAENPPRFPTLLRMACDRLATAKGKTPKSDQKGEKQRTESISDVITQSNLQDPVDVEILVARRDGSNPRSGTSQISVDENTESLPLHESLKEDLASALSAHSLLSMELEKVLKERDSIKTELSAQVTSLNKRIRDLESSIQNQNIAHRTKMSVLEKAKSEAEADVLTLEETVVNSSAKAKEVMTQLQSKVNEIAKLKEELLLEKKGRIEALEEGRRLRDQLQLQVENLSRKLVSQEEEAKRACQLIERELREEYNIISRRDKIRIEELTQSINDTRKEIDRLTSENQSLAVSLRKVEKNHGASVTRNKEKIIINDHKKKYNELITRAVSAEATATAMAKALAISESELAEAVKSKNESEKRCSALLEAKKCLERENLKLKQKMQGMNEELASSRTYIDKLYAQVHSSKENQRDSVDKKFKTQIRNDEAKVSLDLYRKAVKEARSNAAAVNERQQEIQRLSSRLEELENKITQKHEKPVSLRSFMSLQEKKHAADGSTKEKVENHSNRVYQVSSCSSDSRDADEVMASAANGSRATVEFSSWRHTRPQMVSPNEHTEESNLYRKSTFRAVALREAGGRAGLSAKLKKARGTLLRAKDNQIQPLRQRNNHPSQMRMTQTENQTNEPEPFPSTRRREGKENLA